MSVTGQFELSPIDRRNYHDLLAKQMQELTDYRIVVDYNPESLLSKLISISPNTESLLLSIKNEIEHMQRVKNRIVEAVTWLDKLKTNVYSNLKANLEKRLPQNQDLYNRLVHIAQLPPDFARSNAMAEFILKVRFELGTLIKTMQGNRSSTTTQHQSTTSTQQLSTTASSTSTTVLPMPVPMSMSNGLGHSLGHLSAKVSMATHAQMAAENAAKEQQIRQAFNKSVMQIHATLDNIVVGAGRLEQVFIKSFTDADWLVMNENMVGETKGMP